MTADERGESIAQWMEGLAAACRKRATEKPLQGDFYRDAAILYDARAEDVRAGMDIPCPERDINSGEIIV